jgi:hypothetical protein
MFEVENAMGNVCLQTPWLIHAIKFAEQFTTQSVIRRDGKVIMEKRKRALVNLDRKAVEEILLIEMLRLVELFLQKFIGFRELRQGYETIKDFVF